eukprot:scaffold343_cov120-Isochrysis_galbana.AAC.15
MSAASRADSCSAETYGLAVRERCSTLSVSIPPIGVPSTPPIETETAKAKAQADCDVKEPKPSRKTGP